MRTLTTWARRAWHWLTSMSTALILLFILALAAIPGALLPQRQVSATLVDDYLKANPTMGPIYDRLQFFDVFSSTWFVAIVMLLMISWSAASSRAPSTTGAPTARSPRARRSSCPGCRCMRKGASISNCPRWTRTRRPCCGGGTWPPTPPRRTAPARTPSPPNAGTRAS
ncbi:cytochrome c biogenesis protein ResB [Corynebacterium aquatimens]|uniref:cytochrome c biogenesis protein ResB n=1 Tax=Corynebacterium aquatimens TaxID=1190508 RepID=UPI0033132509